MRRLAGIFAAALAGGCAHKAPSPTADAAPAQAAPSAPAVPSSAAEGGGPRVGADAVATVTLLDAGALPRRKLRYAFSADRHEQLTLDLRTTASTGPAGADGGGSGVPLPPVRVGVAIDPIDVSPQGALHYAWRVTSSDVLTAPGTPDALAAGMRAEVAVVAHLGGEGVTADSGLAESVSVDPSTIVRGDGTGEMVDQIAQTLRSVAAPFPAEPIGVGARWEKVDAIASRDGHITQTDTFTLTGITGDKGTLSDVLAQTAPPQPLRAPGMPAGVEARMESMLVSGNAKTAFDLGRLVPQTQIESTTTMVVSGAQAAEARRTTMILRVQVTVAGARR